MMASSSSSGSSLRRRRKRNSNNAHKRTSHKYKAEGKQRAKTKHNDGYSVVTVCAAGNAAQGVGLSERAEMKAEAYPHASAACGADFERLVAWCEEVQGRALSACVRIDKKREGASRNGFGAVQCDVRATRAVSRGEELLRISGDAVATAADLDAYASGRDGIADGSDADMREIAALALLIYTSRQDISDDTPSRRGVAPVAGSRLVTCNATSPLLWTDEETDAIGRGSPTVTDFARRTTRLLELMKDYAGNGIGTTGDERELLSCAAAALRWSFPVPEANVLAINPIVNVLCASSSSATGPGQRNGPERIEFCFDSNSLIVVASRDYEADDPVLMSLAVRQTTYPSVSTAASGARGSLYASLGFPDLTTSEMLWRYGDVEIRGSSALSSSGADIALYRNEMDFLVYEAQLVMGDPLFSIKREVVEAELGVSPVATSTPFSVPDVKIEFPLLNDRMPEQLLAFLRLSRIKDSAEIARIDFSGRARSVQGARGGGSAPGIVSEANEYEVLMLIMADCRERLFAYASSEAETEVRLINELAPAEGDVSRGVALLASILRKQEKQILLSTMNACRQKLLPLRGLAPTKAGMKDVNEDILEIFEAIEDIPNMPKKFLQSLFGPPDSD